MNHYSPRGFKVLPPVIKNLIIINGLFFLGTFVFSSAFGFDLANYLGLHYIKSDGFKPIQFISYMFLHGGMGHIFFNMFALWMFGNVLENLWGPKRFLTYYFVTGIGAAVIQMLIAYLRIKSIESDLSPEQISMVYNEGYDIIQKGMNYTDLAMGKLNALVNGTTIGASGAVFGLLLAFGMLFPNSVIYLYFAIPVKAKYFVIFYGIAELFMGVSNRAGDNVAHFAHLGGMLFGYFLIKYWKKNTYRFQ